MKGDFGEIRSLFSHDEDMDKNRSFHYNGWRTWHFRKSFAAERRKVVEKAVWDDQYNLGVEAIDKAHAIFFGSWES